MNTTYAGGGIVGASAFDRTIAQIAAQAGSTVKLFDVQAQTMAQGRQSLLHQWDNLRAKCRSGALPGIPAGRCVQADQPRIEQPLDGHRRARATACLRLPDATGPSMPGEQV